MATHDDVRRLEAIGTEELEELLMDAWRCQAPRAPVRELDRRDGPR